MLQRLLLSRGCGAMPCSGCWKGETCDSGWQQWAELVSAVTVDNQIDKPSIWELFGRLVKLH